MFYLLEHGRGTSAARSGWLEVRGAAHEKERNYGKVEGEMGWCGELEGGGRGRNEWRVGEV